MADDNNIRANSGPLIFILDDEATQKSLMQKQVAAGINCTVRGFIKLKDMIEDPEIEKVDLFIIDNQLGGDLTGLEVPATLPVNCRFAAYLFVSGYPIDKATYAKAAASIFFDFIAKPFPSVLFIHRIKLLLNARLRVPIKSEQRLLELWTHTPYVAMVLDAKMLIRLANYQLVDLLKVESARAVVGQPWSDFLIDEAIIAFQKAHALILNGGVSAFGEISVDVKSSVGQIHRIRWYNSTFTGLDDDEILTLSVGIPAEAKKQMADQLRQAWHENIKLHRAAIRAIKKLPDIVRSSNRGNDCYAEKPVERI
jgi:hypothetical protein